MKRGSLGIGIVALVTVVGGFLWLLQTRTASEGAAAGAEIVQAAPIGNAPMASLPAPTDLAASSQIVEVDAAPDAPAPELPAGDLASLLRVIVVDEQHLPITGAQVVVKSQWRTPLVSDTEGMALVTAPGGAEVDISARHPDYRFKLLHAVMPEAGAPPGEATIVLTNELTACVHITDDRGDALAGAVVSFREIKVKHHNYFGLFVSAHGTQEELDHFLLNDQFDGNFQESRVSDGTGSCCVSGITAGIVTISVRADGFVYVNQRDFELGPQGGELGTIQLERAVTLEGTVVDAAGPVPGAWVVSAWGGRESGTTVETTTDAAGHFSFNTLPPSTPWIPMRVSHPTRGDFSDPRLVLTPEPLVIELRPSLDVTLRLRDADTRMLIEGDCTLTRIVAHDLLLLAWRSPEKLHVQDGEVRLGWMPYCATGVQVEVANHARNVVPMEALQTGAGAPVDVLLVRSGTIAIHAIDRATGQPVTGAQVLASHKARGSKLDSYFVIESTFDAATSAYVIDTSAFAFDIGFDEAVSVSLPDGRTSPEIPVSTNGVRVCGTTIEATLAHK